MTSSDNPRARTFESGLQSVKRALGIPAALPHAAAMTAIMSHGGLNALVNPERVEALLPSTMQQQVQSMVEAFFYKLVPGAGYIINSDLMSYISFPHDGVAYETPPLFAINETIPAVFTFVGQFIDHDLTMNAVNLTEVQSDGPVVDSASPIIDLDSVYGPRAFLDNAALYGDQSIFNPDGTFKLNAVGIGFDLPRYNNEVSKLQPALIVDARNDENQMLLQVHILIMRVHNALITRNPSGRWGANFQEIVGNVRKEVVLNWQSVILNDDMPAKIEPETLASVLSEIKKPDYGELKHKPLRDLVTGKNVVRLPHEFALAYRFGHSMLRPRYTLNDSPDGQDILLFNNRELGGADDLRGSRPLSPSHVIDWRVFYPEPSVAEHDSLAIDGKITPALFDLPETTIPDDIKYIGNLPQRNLIRSRMLGVTSGEELADFYGVMKLSPEEIVDENHPEARILFKQEGTPEYPFRTPLWYYVLKEAEVRQGGQRLGALGSRLVGEVLAGGIYYGDEFRFDDSWESQITGKNEVHLRDLIDFATKGCLDDARR